MAKKPPLVRPRPTPLQRTEIQAGQTRTLNGQEARNQLEQQPTEQPAPTSVDLPEPGNTSVAESTSENEPQQEETTSELPAPAAAATTTPEVTPPQVVSPSQPVAVSRPSAPTPSAAPAASRRGPGRPPRAAATEQAGEVVLTSADKTQVRITNEQARTIRRARVDLEDRGRKISTVGFVDEAITFYMAHLRETGQLPKV